MQDNIIRLTANENQKASCEFGGKEPLWRLLVPQNAVAECGESEGSQPLKLGIDDGGRR